MSRCDFENSQISAQDTVGVAGDDIMFHILVESVSLVLMWIHLRSVVSDADIKGRDK